MLKTKLLIKMILILTLTTPLYAGPKEYASTLFSDPGTFSVGAGFAMVPKYEGSDEYKAQFLPLVDYDNGLLHLSTTRGIGIYLLNNDNLQLSTFANYRMGRDQDDSDVLNGMGDIDGNAELGAKLTWNPAPFILSATTSYGFSDVKGLLANLYIGHHQTYYNDFSTKIGITASFADSDYMDTFFGITDKQSLRSGHKRYDASSGLKSTGVKFDLGYNFTEHFAINIFNHYDYLANSAADSPLVENGSRNQFASGMMLIFYTSN